MIAIEQKIKLIFDQIVKTDLDEIEKLQQYSQVVNEFFNKKSHLNISEYKSCIASHLLQLSFANIDSPYKNKGEDYVRKYKQILLGRYFKGSFVRDQSPSISPSLSDQTQPNEESQTMNLDPKPSSSEIPHIATPDPKIPMTTDLELLEITVNPHNLAAIPQIESVFRKAKETTSPTKNLIGWITTTLSNLIDDQNAPQYLLHIHIAMLQLAKQQGISINILDSAINAADTYQTFKANKVNNDLAQALIMCFEHKQKLSQTTEHINHTHTRTIQITFGLAMIFALFFGLGSVSLMIPLMPLAMVCGAVNVLANMYFQKYLLSTLNQTQKNAFNVYGNIFIAILVIALCLVATMALTTIPYPVLDAFVLSTLTSFIINQYASSKFNQVVNLASLQQTYDSSYRETKRNLRSFLNPPNKSTKAIDDTNVAQETPEISLFRQPDVQNSQNYPMSDDDLNQIMASIQNSEYIKKA
ncbi:MAG: hypothetical protein P8L77_03170 [Gammaproteobacteria bacterium]|nr:hypothetical protein [Gammaproteobacteria bacterium]